jgi:hypothetical protein
MELSTGSRVWPRDNLNSDDSISIHQCQQHEVRSEGLICKSSNIMPYFLTHIGYFQGGSILSVTNIDTLVMATEREGTQFKQPPQAVYEKVFFLYNNLSQSNLSKKVM